MGKNIKIVVDPIDFTNFIRDNKTDTANIVFVNVFLDMVSDQILDFDDTAIYFSGAKIAKGDTVINPEAMKTYTERFIGTKLPSSYAHAVICHLTQETVDLMSDEALRFTHIYEE